MSRLLSLPWRGWPAIVLCAIYLLAGIFGHDPWKTADAVHLGVAFEFATHGQWLTPRIGSEAWFGTPPLFHWTAAIFGKLLGSLLPFHEAARLATAAFGALLLSALALVSGRLGGSGEAAWGAPMIAIGTLGLLVPIHDAEPAIALIASQAWLFLGLVWIKDKPVPGAAIAGLALGCGFLSAGATALTFMAPMFGVCFLHADWRTSRSAGGILMAVVLGIALASLWPLALYHSAPDSLSPWLKVELARLSPRSLSLQIVSDHLELLGWAAWPVFPLCLWTLWGRQKHLATAPILLPLAATGITMLLLLFFGEPQPLQHLVLLVPMTLLASAGVDRLRRGAANALDWFGMMTFTLIAGLIWLGGVSMDTGLPERVAKNFLKAEPGFVGEFRPLMYIAGLLLTVAWVSLLLRLPRSPWRGVTTWAIGIVVIWGLLTTLWLPWIDYGRSYRPVALSLAGKLGGSNGCIAQLGLGDGQKASLRYFQDIVTLPLAGKGRSCPWLLTQSSSRREIVPEGWKRIWEGNRPGDRSERLRLYRRAMDNAGAGKYAARGDINGTSGAK